jgi:hypothetical protein
MGYTKGCIGLGNITDGPRLMGSDPLREVEVSKKQMSGTTKREIVLVHLTHSVFRSLAGRRLVEFLEYKT